MLDLLVSNVYILVDVNLWMSYLNKQTIFSQVHIKSFLIKDLWDTELQSLIRKILSVAHW